MRLNSILVACTIAVLVVQSSSFAQSLPLNVDLTSTDRNQNPSLNAGQTVTLQEGGTARQITSTDKVTSAEVLAIQQVLQYGAQSVQLGLSGNALGGTLNLSSSTNIQNLVIPAGVTISGDFANNSQLNIAGLFNNSGTFHAFSSDSSIHSASIFATEIVNQQGALITSLLPGSSANRPFDISLHAMHNIINSGTIFSSGTLNLTAGGSVVNGPSMTGQLNQSLIQAVADVNINASNLVNAALISGANINISANVLLNLMVDNTAGRLQALTAINVRSLIESTGNISVIGGELLAKQSNFFAANGIVTVDVNSAASVLNVCAKDAHLRVAVGDLTLGQQSISGDPVYISAGNLVLPSAVAGQPFIAIAGGDILTTNGFVLDTSSDTGSGGSVFLIAGAEASFNGAIVTVTGRSSSGGNVNLSGIASINTQSRLPAATTGGEINLLALSQSPGSTSGGQIFTPSASTLTTGFGGLNAAGNLTMVADGGGSPAPTISGGVFIGASSKLQPVTAKLLTLAPDITSSHPLQINATTGAITSGTLTTGILQNGSISTGNLNATTGAVVVTAGGDIIGGSITTGGSALGSVTLSAGGAIKLNEDITTGSLSISNSGDLSQAAGKTILANNVLLRSTAGSIGNGALPVSINADRLQAFALGDIFIANSSATLQLDKSSGANIDIRVPAGKIDITGDITASGVLSLTAIGGIKAIDYVASKVQVGFQPTGTTVSTDGSYVYVSNSGDNSVSVIDSNSSSVIKVIPVGSSPSGIAVSPDGSMVYVVNRGSNTVSEISAASGAVVKTISVPDSPAGIAFNSSGTLAFVTSPTTGTVTFIRTADGEVDGPSVSVQAGASAVAFNRSNGLVYVGNGAANSISVIDPSTRAVNNYSVGFSPVAFGPCPCGTKIFVSDGVDGVHAFSTELNSVIVNIALPAGTAPGGIGINPTGSLAFVANSGNGTVSTIATLTNTVVNTTVVGGTPSSFGAFAAFKQGSAVAYVADFQNGLVSLLRTPLIKASNYQLTSSTGTVNVNIGAGTVRADNSAGPVVITSASSITSAGGTGTAFQLATPLDIMVTAPISAKNLDLHAINGTFTNLSKITASGALLFIASSTIQNFGTLSINGAAAPVFLGLQAPSGDLSVILGANATLSSAAAGSTGAISFNPAGGGRITISALSGSTISADTENFFGTYAEHKITVNANLISGTVNIRNRPAEVFLQTLSGDLTLSGVTMAPSYSSGTRLEVNALSGNLTIQKITSDYSGTQPNSTIVSLYSAGDIVLHDGLTARGTLSNGGVALLSAPSGVISLDKTASEAFDTSGTSGGTISLVAKFFNVAGTNPDSSSVKSVGVTGSGGFIQIASLSNVPLVIGSISGNNYIAGGINASGINGGGIRLYASGLVINAGTTIAANGTTGFGGTVAIGQAGQLVLQNDGNVLATNNAMDTGIIALSSAPRNNVAVSGSGKIQAGSIVSFGNVNSVTLLPANPVFLPPSKAFNFGGIDVLQGAVVGNSIAVSGAAQPIVAQSVASRNTLDLPVFVFEQPALPANGLIQTDKTPIDADLPEIIRSDRKSDDQGIFSIATNNFVAGLDENPETSRISQLQLNYDAGRVLVHQNKDVQIATPFGSVFIAQGAIVLLSISHSSLAIYDLADDHTGQVRLSWEGQGVVLAPGMVLYVTKQDNSQSGQITNVVNSEGLPLRNVSEQLIGSSIKLTSAEFSLCAAVSRIDSLRRAYSSATGEHRKMINKLLKNAAALSLVSSGHGSYRSP